MVQSVEKSARTADEPGVVFVTPQEGRAMFDAAARYYLNIGGDEFVRRYEAGEYADRLSESVIQHLLSLRRFAEE